MPNYPEVYDRAAPIFENFIASDEFCEAYQGESCPWPKLPEFYASSLNWQMVNPATDWLMNVAPSTFEQWY